MHTSPETFTYYPLGPWINVFDLVTTLERHARRSEAVLLYAILDKTKPKVIDENGHESWPMAGTVGFLSTNPNNLSIEVGYLVIFPAFRRTHITANAVGLLTLFALTPETSFGATEFPDGGLGYRRVAYQAHYLNEPSIRVAERFGFVREAIQKWQRVLLSLDKGGKRRLGDGLKVRLQSYAMPSEDKSWEKYTVGLFRSSKSSRWELGESTRRIAVCESYASHSV